MLCVCRSRECGKNMEHNLYATWEATRIDKLWFLRLRFNSKIFFILYLPFKESIEGGIQMWIIKYIYLHYKLTLNEGVRIPMCVRNGLKKAKMYIYIPYRFWAIPATLDLTWNRKCSKSTFPKVWEIHDSHHSSVKIVQLECDSMEFAKENAMSWLRVE